MWNRNSRWKWVDSRGFIGRILNNGANREDFYRGKKVFLLRGKFIRQFNRKRFVERIFDR